MSNHFLPLLAERVLNEPLLISAAKAGVILEVLGGRIGLDGFAGPEASAFAREGWRDQGRAPFMVAGGVAIIPVHGTLVNRGGWVGASSGLTSYEGLAAQIDAAEADPEVRAILLDINSHGGEAAGMPELAAKVRAASMPVVAHVNAMAASAAYGIASAAREIVIGASASVGSIGVLVVHYDQSARMEMEGISPTIIHAGARKVDGHPFGPLPDRVRADLQTRVDRIYGEFLGLVAEGRGARLTAEQARATEAGMFTGADAVAAGLADRIATFDEVLRGLQSNARRGATTLKEMSMGEKTSAEQAELTFSAADIETARAEGYTAGAADAKARIAAILTSDEAKGRRAQAETIALTTDLSADQARALLAAAPVETKAGVQTIEERAEGLPEFGATTPETKTKMPLTDLAAAMNKETA